MCVTSSGRNVLNTVATVATGSRYKEKEMVAIVGAGRGIIGGTRTSIKLVDGHGGIFERKQ